MIKKIIIAGIMGLSLCTPHIKAEMARTTAPQTQEEKNEEKNSETTPAATRKPLYVPVIEPEKPLDQRFMCLLIAFCVDLAFTFYTQSAP